MLPVNSSNRTRQHPARAINPTLTITQLERCYVLLSVHSSGVPVLGCVLPFSTGLPF